MGGVVTMLVTPVNRWYCPNCQKEDVTHEARPHTRFHTCPKLRGLTAPMVAAGTKAKPIVYEGARSASAMENFIRSKGASFNK